MKPEEILEKIDLDYFNSFKKNHLAPKFITMNTKTCEYLGFYFSNLTEWFKNDQSLPVHILGMKILRTEDLEINEFIIH